MIVLPVFVALMWHRRPIWKTVLAGAIMLAVAALLAAPWQLYIRQAFPTEYRIESEYNWKHLVVAVEDHNGPWYYHFGKAYEFYGVLVYPAILLALWLFFRNKLPRGAGPMLLWFSLTYLVFTLAATKMGGYVLIAAPAIFFLMALVLAAAQDHAERDPGTRIWVPIWFLLFTVTAGVPIMQRLNIFNGVPREPAWAAALRDVEQELKPTDKPLVIFNDAHPIETMFDTNMIAYERIPTDGDLTRLKNLGYQSVVLIPIGDASPPNLPTADNLRTLPAPPALWEK